MKKSLIILAISNFMVGILGTSCKSDADKEFTSDEEKLTQEAMEHMKEEMKEEEMIDSFHASNIAKSDSIEWNAYKKEVKTEIDLNNKLISNLKSKNKKPDAAFLKNINEIEKTNTDLLANVNSYAISRDSDWEDFKKEIEYKLEELDKSIDNLNAGKSK